MGICSNLCARIGTKRDVASLVELAQRMQRNHRIGFLPQSAEEFFSKYRSYHGGSDDLNIFILSHADGSIIGCSGYILFKGLFAGKPLDGFIGADAVIDADYRKQFPNLAPVLAHCYEPLVRKRRLFALACPANEAVSSAFQKVQWRRFTPIQALFNPLAAQLAPDIASPSFEIKVMDHFPDSLASFFKKVSGQHAFILNADVAYLNWRYFQNPYSSYHVLMAFKQTEIVGYLVTQQLHSDISIVDCVIDLHYPRVLLQLIFKALAYHESNQLTKTLCYASHARYIDILKKTGFVHYRTLDFLFFKVGLLYSSIDHQAFYASDKTLYHFNGFDQNFY